MPSPSPGYFLPRDAALDRIARACREAGSVFRPVPLVVGAQWLNTPIRQALAHRFGVAANLRFLSVEQALDGLLDAPDPSEAAPVWWDARPADPRWAPSALRSRVLTVLRAHTGDDALRTLAASLGITPAGPLSWNAVAFAEQVAQAVLDWMHTRPEAPVTALGQPSASGIGGAPWLPLLVSRLGVDAPDSPRARRAALLREPSPRPAPAGGLLVVGTTGLASTPERLLRQLGAEFLPLVAEPPSTMDLAPNLRIRPCYGPLREVEALRDWLLELLAEGPGAHGLPGLTPRDVLVLTPSPQVYGPLIQAVFGRSGADPAEREDDSPPTIPVHLTELGLARANPLAETLLQLLELAEDRVELPSLGTLLGLAPVQRRFALAPDEVAEALELLRDSGARWAFDSADRAGHFQPPLAQNTLKFGLERMALGRLLPTNTLDTSASDDPRVAMDLGTRERMSSFGQVDRLVRTLHSAIRTLRGDAAQGRTAADWRASLDALLETFAETSESAAWQHEHLAEALDLVLPRDDDAGLYSASAVRRMLQEGFAIPQSAPGPHEGAVTVAALRPHGVGPHRVVALLGMGLGAFPRSGVLPAWHPLSTTLPGERSPRELDRSLFHAVQGAAGERLWLSWPAFEMQRGRELPPCVPVAELIEAAGLAATLHSALVAAPAPAARLDRDARVSRVHRHPWAAHPAQIHDPAYRRETPGARTPPLPELDDPDCPVSLTVDDLVRALVNPSEVFLRERLGIYLYEDDPEPPAREPLDLSGLEVYDVRKRIFDACIEAGTSASAVQHVVLQRLRGEGALPLQSGAEVIVADESATVDALLAEWQDSAPEGEAAPKEWSAAINGVQLSARVDRAVSSPDTLILSTLRVSKPVGRHAELRGWVTALVGAVADPLGRRVRCVQLGLSGSSVKAAETPEINGEDAAPILSGLVDVWRQARRSPIPLFPESSAEIAEVLAKEDAPAHVRARLLREVAQGFAAREDDFSSPDHQNRWVRVAFPSFDAEAALLEPESPMITLAEKVWTPLLQRRAAEKAAAEGGAA